MRRVPAAGMEGFVVPTLSGVDVGRGTIPAGAWPAMAEAVGASLVVSRHSEAIGVIRALGSRLHVLTATSGAADEAVQWLTAARSDDDGEALAEPPDRACCACMETGCGGGWVRCHGTDHWMHANCMLQHLRLDPAAGRCPECRAPIDDTAHDDLQRWQLRERGKAPAVLVIGNGTGSIVQALAAAMAKAGGAFRIVAAAVHQDHAADWTQAGAAAAAVHAWGSRGAQVMREIYFTPEALCIGERRGNPARLLIGAARTNGPGWTAVPPNIAMQADHDVRHFRALCHFGASQELGGALLTLVDATGEEAAIDFGVSTLQPGRATGEELPCREVYDFHIRVSGGRAAEAAEHVRQTLRDAQAGSDPDEYFGWDDRQQWAETAIVPMRTQQVASAVERIVRGGPAARMMTFTACQAGLRASGGDAELLAQALAAIDYDRWIPPHSRPVVMRPAAGGSCSRLRLVTADVDRPRQCFVVTDAIVPASEVRQAAGSEGAAIFTAMEVIGQHPDGRERVMVRLVERHGPRAAAAAAARRGCLFIGPHRLEVLLDVLWRTRPAVPRTQVNSEMAAIERARAAGVGPGGSYQVQMEFRQADLQGQLTAGPARQIRPSRVEAPSWLRANGPLVAQLYRHPLSGTSITFVRTGARPLHQGPADGEFSIERAAATLGPGTGPLEALDGAADGRGRQAWLYEGDVWFWRVGEQTVVTITGAGEEAVASVAGGAWLRIDGPSAERSPQHRQHTRAVMVDVAGGELAWRAEGSGSRAARRVHAAHRAEAAGQAQAARDGAADRDRAGNAAGLAADPGGALTAWVRSVERDGNIGDGSGGTAAARAAAWAALGPWPAAAREGLVGELAVWLEAPAAQRGVRPAGEEWDAGICTWTFERLGINRLFVIEPARAEQIVNEAGIAVNHAEAPTGAWRLGRTCGCGGAAPAAPRAGRWWTAAHGSRMVLGPEARRALDGVPPTAPPAPPAAQPAGSGGPGDVGMADAGAGGLGDRAAAGGGDQDMGHGPENPQRQPEGLGGAPDANGNPAADADLPMPDAAGDGHGADWDGGAGSDDGDGRPPPQGPIADARPFEVAVPEEPGPAAGGSGGAAARSGGREDGRPLAARRAAGKQARRQDKEQGSRRDGADDGMRPLVVLSAFDGMGVIWHAIDDLVGRRQLNGRVVACWAVEKEQRLADEVVRWWGEDSRLGRRLMVRLAAYDVWDLFRNGGWRLKQVLHSAPIGAVLLVAGGSPCQQFCRTGTGKGAVGLCGQDSVHLYAIPAIVWVTRIARPDLQVHILVENSAEIDEPHRTAIRRMLGVAAGDHAVLEGAGAFARRRSWLSTLPYMRNFRRAPRRGTVWEDGWEHKGGGVMPTMMRARGTAANGEVIYSAYQYAPRHLLWRKAEWDGVGLEAAAVGIRQRMPEELRAGWTDIIAGQYFKGDRTREAAMDRTAAWLAANGDAIGARPPNVRERARAMGLGHFVPHLRLSEEEKVNAIGNSFDKDQLATRAEPGLIEVMANSGAVSMPEQFMAPSELVLLHQDVADQLRRAQVIYQEDVPFPDDLMRSSVWDAIVDSPAAWVPPAEAAAGGGERPAAGGRPRPDAGGQGSMDRDEFQRRARAALGNLPGGAAAIENKRILRGDPGSCQEEGALATATRMADAFGQLARGGPRAADCPAASEAAAWTAQATGHVATVTGTGKGTRELWAVWQAATGGGIQAALVELILDGAEGPTAAVYEPEHEWNGTGLVIARAGDAIVPLHFAPSGAAGPVQAALTLPRDVGRVGAADLPEAVRGVLEAGYELYGWRPWEGGGCGETIARGAAARGRHAVPPAGGRDIGYEGVHRAAMEELFHGVGTRAADDLQVPAEVVVVYSTARPGTDPAATPGGREWHARRVPEGPIELVLFFSQRGAAWAAATASGDGCLRAMIAAHGGRRAA